MTIHMVGQLNEKDELKYLFVLRQEMHQHQAQLEYKKGLKPLAQSTNVMETYPFVSFAIEHAENNAKLSIVNPLYGRKFEECYKNCRMMSFDTNFGESLDPNVEVFAVKMWKPLNAVKIFTFNYDNCQV